MNRDLSAVPPGTRFGKRVVLRSDVILRATSKVRGLWVRCDSGREDLVDRYLLTKGLAKQCLDCQKNEQSLRMQAVWAERKGREL